MKSRTTREGGTITVAHEFVLGAAHSLEVVARDETHVPGEDSLEHFFKEHAWGFGRDRRGRTLRYQVQHPAWEVYREPRVELDVDFGEVYGYDFAALSSATPYSVVLAVGSPIVVYGKTTLPRQ